jgi:UDP-N-acetylmuramoylalanine--D-glutamate ligase
VVILGGDGKGQDFSPLKEAVAQHARAVVLIGRDAPLIEKAIAGCGRPVLHARDMDEAVALSTANARSGDAVLMSPACASFDMYRNYLHRAEVFIAAVKRLEASC